MPKWKWIERRAAAIMKFYGVASAEALIAAQEDWDWRNMP